MAYSLSFNEEFFWGEGYGPCGPYPEPSDKPTSVLQALISMSAEDWELMSRELFKCDNADVEDVMALLRETDTCANIHVGLDGEIPVEVFIDPDGDWRVSVWDGKAKDAGKPRENVDPYVDARDDL